MSRPGTRIGDRDVDWRAAIVAAALTAPKYELVPLKHVLDQAEFLPEGATVSVTASPAKGMGATIDLALALRAMGFEAIPHLAARSIADGEELRSILARLDEAGITKALVVGGDADDHGEFFDGLSLLAAMAEIGHGLTEIGIPGYPEGHHVVDEATIAAAIEAKAPFASYLTSQVCFAPDAITAWVEGLRQDGLGLGVYIGIPGVAELTKLITLSVRIGVGPSVRFLSKNTGLIGLLARPGRYRPSDLVVALGPLFADAAANVHGFHIYTFNRVEATEQWRLDLLEELA